MISTHKIESIYAKHGQFITSDEAARLRALFYELAKTRIKKSATLPTNNHIKTPTK